MAMAIVIDVAIDLESLLVAEIAMTKRKHQEGQRDDAEDDVDDDHYADVQVPWRRPAQPDPLRSASTGPSRSSSRAVESTTARARRTTRAAGRTPTCQGSG